MTTTVHFQQHRRQYCRQTFRSHALLLGSWQLRSPFLSLLHICIDANLQVLLEISQSISIFFSSYTNDAQDTVICEEIMKLPMSAKHCNATASERVVEIDRVTVCISDMCQSMVLLSVLERVGYL